LALTMSMSTRLRVAMLGLYATGAAAYLGNTTTPVSCCFTLGFASNQVPCCFESQKVDSKDACTLTHPVGGSLGFNQTICPESADEAACILQSATIPPAGLAPGSYPPVGPECSALYNEHDDTEEGEEPESVPGEPGYPDTNDQSKKERVKPLISEKAVRLRALQPQHGSHEDFRRPAPASAWEA